MFRRRKNKPRGGCVKDNMGAPIPFLPKNATMQSNGEMGPKKRDTVEVDRELSIIAQIEYDMRCTAAFLILTL
jgi:hypothetical protein